jgi:hypothetical protein
MRTGKVLQLQNDHLTTILGSSTEGTLTISNNEVLSATPVTGFATLPRLRQYKGCDTLLAWKTLRDPTGLMAPSDLLKRGSFQQLLLSLSSSNQ